MTVPPHTTKTTLTMALIMVAAGTILAGCGVPAEARAQIIAEDALPFGLAATSTTAPHVAVFDPIITTESVDLYFTSDKGFVRVARDVTTPLFLLNVVDALAAEPNDATNNFRSAVGPDDVRGVSVRAGVASVQLDESFLDLPTAEQRLAVAQLVLTLTARPGIGQIDFVVGDEPVQVPRADGTLAKGAVSRDDFLELLQP